MVYYRKYRRTGRGRSYARRGRSGYSMYKLYKSRSSAAQARQIYGLNRKMKAIQRMTKPEIKIAPLVQYSITSSTEAGDLVNGVRIFNGFNLTNLQAQSTGTTTQANYAQLDGRFARIQNITMKGIFTYNTPGVFTEENADLQRMPGFMRIVIVQTKTSRGQNVNYNDIFSTTTAGIDPGPGGNALTPYSMIRAPLKYGAARIVKFLSDKTYMLSDTKQSVNIKTKLKYVRNWYDSTTELRPKGQVYMFVMLYQQDADNQYSVSELRFDFISKCVYTDA